MKSLRGLIFVLGLGSSTAGAAPLVVEALFDAKSRMPGVLMPFQVTGDVMSGGTIVDVQIEHPDSSVQCHGMVDPHIASIVLVKCSAPQQIVISLRVVQAGQFFEQRFGAYDIKYPAGGSPVNPNPVVDPDILAGKQLFNSWCVKCHNPPTQKRGRTAAQIIGSISTVPSMVNVKSEADGASVLTADEAKKLEAYLKSL
jgi:hypothetical protein